jgi:phenylalanyl-tRNA synthetase beta chain
LLALTGHAKEFIFSATEHPVLHPGQASQINYQGETVGYVGALHPALLHELDLIGPVYLFELQIQPITTAVIPKFQALSKFPAVRRDISFWIDASVPVQEIFLQARAAAGEWLNDLGLFDVYVEKNGESKQRSLAMGLIWQHPERTLVDAEVDNLKEQVVAKLKQSFAIILRD